MKPRVHYSLLADGTSDRALIKVIDWVMAQHLADRFVVQGEMADLRRIPRAALGLEDRIRSLVHLFPANLYFVHRDAEREPKADRVAEIETALAASDQAIRLIPVVPVRMTEAWLLFNEQAIRSAAGNPSGRAAISLPALRVLESLPNPKDVLFDCLSRASELQGRRLRAFRPSVARSLLADQINDFSPLRSLTAFEEFYMEVGRVVTEVFVDGA